MNNSQNGHKRVSTGIPALDEITSGGLPQGEMYVVNGAPGTGKTVLALHFLQAGVKAGETTLCVALTQRTASILKTARSVNIDTAGVEFREISSIQGDAPLAEQQTIFDTSALELETITRKLAQLIDAVQPQRVVFDSISYIRMLSENTIAYRRQLLQLRDYIVNQKITLMLTDTQELAPGGNELTAAAHGVINLSKERTPYGGDYRYLQVGKVRDSDFQAGIHDMEITDQGIKVYPLYGQAISQPQPPDGKPVISGIDALDQLTGGGLLTGTSCLLIGPSGTGKTSIATVFADNFVQKGGKASIFLFDELKTTFLKRSNALGLAVDPAKNPAHVRIHELGLHNITPGKFAAMVEKDVMDWGARVVVIDSLTGYTNSMPDTRKIFTQMHELLIALSRQNVLTMLVVAQHGVIGSNLEEGIDISYLADTVLLLRHFEASGALHRAIGVYKKRYGSHEMGIREVTLESGNIRIGQPLNQFVGILSGIPNYIGKEQKLMESNEPSR